MPLLREPLCHYRYDALDRLIGHAQQDAQQHRRFYCKSRLATEIQGALQHSIVQHGDLLLCAAAKWRAMHSTPHAAGHRSTTLRVAHA